MKGRSRHISLQNDTVAMFVQGHVTVFLYFHDVHRRERHKVVIRKCALQEKVYSTLLCPWSVGRNLYFFYEKAPNMV